MNKDRIQGSVEQAKGKIKEVAGKVTGDAKLETEGKTQQVAGKIQNAVGGFKDAVTLSGHRGVTVQCPLSRAWLLSSYRHIKGKEWFDLGAIIGRVSR